MKHHTRTPFPMARFAVAWLILTALVLAGPAVLLAVATVVDVVVIVVSGAVLALFGMWF